MYDKTFSLKIMTDVYTQHIHGKKKKKNSLMVTPCDIFKVIK